jgi:hypothetical protein
MRILRFIFSLLVIFFISTNVFAQFQGKVYEQFYNPIVNKSGNDMLAAWCGGINSAQINHVDINNDSKKDLVLYDQNTSTVKTFLNVGVFGEIKYKYEPLYV